MRDEIVDLMEVKPKILQRKTVVERILEKIRNFVDVFYTDMPEVDGEE
ncbi:hypothetical protein QNI19_38125 [Cytophagaceae bacterium DM2B3-1]|uniref:Uncharacterized protein n=1 Tax=Xanthocytophaga flava TaxID=3048013 RepID=A0ABT7CYF0_9BACT|nr:hypothetical protein [Xanthocytophaga flavus]MDJ1498810.1 hypothetical protein [Xanthocytophaga flavus]